MSTISRVLGWFLTLSGISILCLVGMLWLDGKDIAGSAGQAWIKLHPLSLTQLQQLTWKYFGFEAWEGFVVTLLGQPTWLAMVELSVLALSLGILFLLLGQRSSTQTSAGPGTA